jgi:long-chain acyl-CoA synthetase
MPEHPRATLLGQLRQLPPGTKLTTRWTAAELAALADEQAAALRCQDVTRGEAVALAMRNGDGWVLAFLALLGAGARPLLLAPETPEPERARLLGVAGGGRSLPAEATRADDGLTLVGEPAAGHGEPGVLLATSGSTGEPKLVSRTESSLIAEGARYRELLGLGPADRVLLPLPLSHAYALGWLAASLISGAEVQALQPTALHAIADDLRERATIVALVPTMARLLAARQLQRNAKAPAPHLKIAMVGAGAVDGTLDAMFSQAFGLATSRNYGSTETGAVFAGLAPLPPLCVGQPMPGVGYRIVDDAGLLCAPGAPGSLQVKLGSDQGWHDMSDIAEASQDGVTILGRRSAGLRRAGQWVAPLEVEAVLREHDEVRDAHVWSRAGRFGGEDVLVADVEVADPRGLSAADLATFARHRLAPHKVPQEIRIHRRLIRTPAGKVAAPRRYRLADSETLLRASRAYRISELLFALSDLGALPLLADGADVDDLARSLGVPGPEMDWLLSVASGLKLVEPDGGDPAAPGLPGQPAGPVADALPFLELEAELSRSWVTRIAITEAAKAGLDRRPFERAAVDDRLALAYSRAMHDAAAAQRTRLAVRLSRHLRRHRVVEVSAGPGRYLGQLLADGQTSTGHLVRLGKLAGDVDHEVAAGGAAGRIVVDDDPPSKDFDLCVVANGIHGPAPGDDLRWLLDLVRPGGAVLIDDVFLPPDGGAGSELGLDWLTHGGIAWPHVSELTDALAAAGLDICVNKKLGSTGCHLILAVQG